METRSQPDVLLPGQDLVAQGLADLDHGRLTEASMLLLVAGPRLRELGVPVPDKASAEPWEHRLYELLEERLGTSAHSFYNGLLRRIDSYAHALERERSRQQAQSVTGPASTGTEPPHPSPS